MTPRDAEQLKRSVAEERAEVNSTLDELQSRLTPGQLVDEVLRHGRSPGQDFLANLGRTLADNPIPTALVGVGLMWLLLAKQPARPASEVAVEPTPHNETPHE